MSFLRRRLPEDFWEHLEQAGNLGIFQRIEEGHPGDFYAAVDVHGRRGLVLISSQPLPSIPDLENLEIECMQQEDGRWRTCVWVANKELRGLFASLVQDILESSRALPRDAIAEFVPARILRWRDLLEAGADKIELWRLRGLVGELVVLRSLCGLVTPPEAVAAWQGPLGSAQDFVFQHSRIEAKAIGPTARRVRITSADQLDVPDSVNLRLVTVVLASTTAEANDGFTLEDIVTEIRSILTAHANAADDFNRRIAAAGIGEIGSCREFLFRLDAIRSFVVQGSFPRIIPSMLMGGIGEVVYDIVLADIADYESALGD